MVDSNITTNIASWDSEENYVEQAMESAMYNSAHADDTLVLIGPARKPTSDVAGALTAVGVLQNFSITQQKQITPHSAIGSARTFFQASKVMVSGSIQRLFINGKNLYRVLYENAYKGGYKLQSKPLPHAAENTKFLVNLDSNLFLIPFGMAVVYRDKAKNTLGGIYIELMTIPMWSSQISAGSPTIVEGTSFMADRVRALSLNGLSKTGTEAETNLMNDITAVGNSDLESRLDKILTTK